MAGKMSQNKGKRGEREIVRLLQPIVDKVYSDNSLPVPKVKRNGSQADSGGYDLVGVDWLAVEVKYQESFSLSKWWEQTTQQAGPNELPVLFYRKNHVPWRVRMLGHLQWDSTGEPVVVDISIEAFLAYFERLLRLAVPG